MALGDLKFKGILFGNDLWGYVVHEEMPYINPDYKIEMKRYLIIPSRDLIDAHPEILKKPKIRTKRGDAIWVEYPTYWIEDDNPSRSSAIVRILCRYDGYPTPPTRRMEKYTGKIKELEIEKDTLTISNEILIREKGTLLGEVSVLLKKLAELNEIIKGEKRETEQSKEYLPGTTP